jgi:mono/diheme cytochrome c family protein
MRFRAFVISSILLFVATILAVWVDYDKDWKKYQKDFNKLEYNKTQDEYESAKKFVDSNPDFQKLSASLRTSEEKVNSSTVKEQQKDLEEKIRKLKYENYTTEREAKFTKSRLDAVEYQIVKNNNIGANTASLVAKRDEMKDLWEKQKQVNVEAKGRLTKAQDELAALTADYMGLKAKYDEKMTEVALLEKKLDGIAKRPLEIQQVLVPELNNAVDRCMSCHMAANKDGFEDKKYPLVFRTHPNRELYLVKHNVKDFGCVVCHQGQGLATTKPEVAHGWVEFWDKPMLKGKQVESSCVKCHKTMDEIADNAQFLSKGKDIVTASNCLACHKVEGQQVAPRNAPPLIQAASKLNPSWLVNWVENPRHYLPKSKMPTFPFNKDQATAIATYVLSSSDNTYGLKKNVVPDPSMVKEGEKLFVAKTCNTCHSIRGVGGSVGPDLGRVGSKDNPTWMFNWIKNPRSYHPTTVMPTFGLSDHDVMALVSYLQTFKWDNMPDYSLNLDNKDIADKGKDLMKNHGCASCHNVVGLEANQIAPELTGIFAKDIHKFDFGYAHKDPERGIYHARESYIYNKIRTPWLYQDFVKARMPRFWFTDDQTSAVYTYIKSITDKNDDIPYKYIYKPKSSVEESNEEVK